MQHKNKDTRQEQDFEARLKEMLGHMTYNEKIMLLSLLEGVQSDQLPSLYPHDSNEKTSQ
jgi:hypothetical protein|nr:MAG TPA: hypothetical protein [Caudoviricetes sp.]